MPAGPAVLRFSRGLPPSKQFGERLRLLVIQGEDKGTCFSMLGDTIFVGREGCQIVLKDSNISKKHAELGWKNDHYVVRDLGSSNGILHNGNKVTEAALKQGDMLMIGLTMLEVYPAGQTRRNDRPLLPGTPRRPALPAVGSAPAPASLSPEDIKKKRETDKKRLVIYVGLFFLAFMLYFSEGDQNTIRGNAKLETSEPETAKKKGKSQTKEQIQEALAEYIPNYNLDTQQRKDAEIFFRNGVRELQNKNYRRAFTAFETALTVDSTHELAKIYLKSAKKEMLTELDNTSKAALRAHKSLRYKEARMHYENIIRYLEGETGNNEFMDNEASKKIKKMFEDAQEAIKTLDKEENKIK